MRLSLARLALARLARRPLAAAALLTCCCMPLLPAAVLARDIPRPSPSPTLGERAEQERKRREAAKTGRPAAPVRQYTDQDESWKSRAGLFRSTRYGFGVTFPDDPAVADEILDRLKGGPPIPGGLSRITCRLTRPGHELFASGAQLPAAYVAGNRPASLLQLAAAQAALDFGGLYLDSMEAEGPTSMAFRMGMVWKEGNDISGAYGVLRLDGNRLFTVAVIGLRQRTSYDNNVVEEERERFLRSFKVLPAAQP